MKESVAIAKEADTMSSPTKSSDKSIHRARNEPERQLGSLRGVIDNITRDGGTPSVDSIATELSGMPTVQRASVLLALQQTHGNQYVQRVVTGIQAKLAVGKPGDIYEQEADRMADAVMRMPEPQVERQTEEEEKPLIQPKTITPILVSQTLQLQDDEEEELKKKKKEKEEAELIMAKAISGKAPEISDNLQARLNKSKGGGQPLPMVTKTFMESRFGVDFSAVKVHTDSQAVQMARELNAVAFTFGTDIYFGVGRYNLEASSGKKLLAHELTHVVQQGREQELHRQAAIGSSNDHFEREAEQIAKQIVSEAGILAETSQEIVAESSIPVEEAVGYRVEGKSETTKIKIRRASKPVSRISGRPRIQRLCTKTPAEAGYEVRVNFRVPPTPALDHSHNTAWISARVGDYTGMTAGLTERNHPMHLAFDTRTEGGRSWVTRIRVWLQNPWIRIFITNAMAAGSCEYNNLLRHERRHDTDYRSNISQAETNVCNSAVGWPSAAHLLPTSVLSARDLGTQMNDWKAVENWRLNYENWLDTCVGDIVDYPRLYTRCSGTTWIAPAVSCPPAPVRPTGTVFPLPTR